MWTRGLLNDPCGVPLSLEICQVFYKSLFMARESADQWVWCLDKIVP